MAIFIIGANKINSERYFRLYNSKVEDNAVRNIAEKDLIYMMRSNPNFKIQNADYRDGKIVGSTGSLEKIENQICITVIGAINENNSLAGYKFVDTTGRVYNMRTEDALHFLTDKPIQNASVVNGSYLRGINWEIPVIEDKEKVRNKESKKKPAYLHVDLNMMNYKYSRKMTDWVSSQSISTPLKDNEFLVYITSAAYTLYVPYELSPQFIKVLNKDRRIAAVPLDGKGNMVPLRLPFIGKGFKADIEMLLDVCKQLNTEMSVSLVCSKDTELVGGYECLIWDIIDDAKNDGLDLRKAFFLGSRNIVFGNLKGSLLTYVNIMDAQIETICKGFDIAFKKEYSKGNAEPKISVFDYIKIPDGYGCIMLRVNNR